MGDVVGEPLASLLNQIQRAPEAAVERIDRLLAPVSSESRPRLASLMWAKGLALRELSRPTDAAAAFIAAAAEADRMGQADLAARVRVSLSLTLAHLGRFDEALRTIDGAANALRGDESIEAQAQRALILQRAGRFEDALLEWDAVVTTFGEKGAEISHAKALVNRGTVLVYLGSRQAAIADLEAAEARFRMVDAQVWAAEAVHDQGFAASRFGDIPTALALFDKAQRQFGSLGVDKPVANVDRIETLLVARLAHEAASLAVETARELQAKELMTDLAEVSLLAARAFYDLADLETSYKWATRSYALFREQSRPRWASLAHLEALRVHESVTVELEELIDELASYGWLAAAVEACLIQIRSIGPRHHAEARAIAARAAQLGRNLPAASRAQVWLIEALARVAEGRSASALRALDAGVAVLERHQDSLGAADLRATAGSRIAELVAVATPLVRSRAQPRRLFDWFERGRVSVIGSSAPTRNDEEIVTALDQLRATAARLEREDLDPASSARHRRKITALEELIRRRSRYDQGQPLAAKRRRVSCAEMSDLLGPRVLVEFGTIDGVINAVVSEDGRWRCRTLCPVGTVSRIVDELGHALNGYVASHQRRRDVRTHIARLARQAQSMLVDPLRIVPGRSLLLVPIGPLHALPWAAMPCLRSRPFVVSPSALIWSSATKRSALPANPTLVAAAGPLLNHAEREARQIAELYETSTLLLADRLTSSALCDAIERSDIVHVASHATFRADNPLFSALRLSDGSLSGFEMSRLERQPDLYVLSACDAAATTRESSGVMGIAATLLSAGAASVIASVTRSDDAETASLMVELHANIRKGHATDVSLAAARAAQGDPAISSGFAVYGAAVQLHRGGTRPLISRRLTQSR